MSDHDYRDPPAGQPNRRRCRDHLAQADQLTMATHITKDEGGLSVWKTPPSRRATGCVTRKCGERF
jgi:hypothetical protein